MEANVDPTGDCLKQIGIESEPAFFGQSAVQIGWRIRLRNLELVYRQEDDVLIICDLRLCDISTVSSGAVATFIGLIHRLEKESRLREVRGMLIETMANPQLNQLRSRLATVLEAEGAGWQEIDGENWLVYPMRTTWQHD